METRAKDSEHRERRQIRVVLSGFRGKGCLQGLVPVKRVGVGRKGEGSQRALDSAQNMQQSVQNGTALVTSVT